MKKHNQSKIVVPTVSAATIAAAKFTPPAKPAPATPKVLPEGFPHDKCLMLEVFKIQNPSRNRACNDFAMKIITKLAPEGCTIIRNKGNLLIRKGPNSGPHPYFLAHMDQVHDYTPFMKVRVTGNLLHATDGNEQRCGVGGDDKCGVYLALAMLHALPHCTAVFVRDEEVGCLGSGDVPLMWFEHAAFVIQADRNNRTMDVIRSTNGMECASDEFMEAVLGLPVCVAAGHTENSGSVTDIGELSERGLTVSMVNISSGYHSPHSRNEIVLLDELSVALQLAYEAATTMGHTRWDHKPTSSGGAYTGGASSVYGGKSYAPSAWNTTAASARQGFAAERDPWGDDWGKGLGGNAAGNHYGTGDLLNAAEVAELQADLDDKQYREELIAELTALHGYDRDFDCLDVWHTQELEDVLEDHEAKALRLPDTK